LTEAGFDVQLKHDQKETTWQDHGYVKIVVTQTGKELASSSDVQHNQQYEAALKIHKKLVQDAVKNAKA